MPQHSAAPPLLNFGKVLRFNKLALSKSYRKFPSKYVFNNKNHFSILIILSCLVSSEIMTLYSGKQISVSFSRKSRDVNGSLMTHFCLLCTFFGPSIILASFAICTSQRFFQIRKLFYFVNYVNLVKGQEAGSSEPNSNNKAVRIRFLLQV